MHPREGDERLSGHNKDDPRSAVGRDNPKPKSKARKASAGSQDSVKLKTDVGRALRSVYDTTLREEIPRDFLDLLGKLD